MWILELAVKTGLVLEQRQDHCILLINLTDPVPLFTGGEDADHHRHLLWSVLAASALLHSGYGDHQHGQVGGQ